MAKQSTINLSTTVETASFEEYLEDPPEVEVTKLHDQFQLLKAKALFLKSGLNDSDEVQDGSERDKGASKNHSEPSSFLGSCCLRVLRERMMSRSVMCHQLLRMLMMPPTPATASPLLCSTFNRLKERLEVMARQSSELQQLEAQLEGARREMEEAQKGAKAAAEELSQQLEGQGDTLKQLRASHTHRETAALQSGIYRKLTRINFMRSLLVLLVSQCGGNLRENRELASALFSCGTPITMQSLRESAATPSGDQNQ